MALHEHLVGIQVAVAGTGNQIAVPHRRFRLHCCPAINSRLSCRASMPQPAEKYPARAGGLPAARRLRSAKMGGNAATRLS